MKELKIILSGRVQGVRFRHFVKETADVLDVKGYVQNQPDGSVLVVAQGSEGNLKIFLERLQKGNALSKIDSFHYIWREASEIFESFEIKIDKAFVADQTLSLFNLSKSLFHMRTKSPRHVAIIPDGNRRWAQERGKPGIEGHAYASRYEHLRSLLDEARNLGVEYVTFWAFSTDNWQREKHEVDRLFSLMTRVLKRLERDAVAKKIRFRHIGRRDRLPGKLLRAIESLEGRTKDFQDFNLQIAIDYGGRDEILRAVNRMLANGDKSVSEGDFMKYLDTHEIPDPDLIIRTAGEYRLSGFMPVQGAYAEFYFTDRKFPDFMPEDLRAAVSEFVRRKRNYGK
ncbi:MAG: polyprenyl diphosphate synthase [Nanoarchaeota archaeon]